MKKLSYLIILILGLFMIECDSNEEEAVPFSISKSDVCFTAKGGEGNINVIAPGSFSITSTADWCVATTSGNLISVSVPANPDYASRTALIKITFSGHTLSVPVTQEGVQLRPTQDQVVFNKNGGEQKIVFPNLPEGWSVSVTDDWCSLLQKADTLFISALHNTRDSILLDTITVISGNTHKQIPVKQANKSLNEYFTTSLIPWYFNATKTTGDYSIIFNMINTDLQRLTPPETLKEAYLSLKADRSTHILTFTTSNGDEIFENSLTYNFVPIENTENQVGITFTAMAFGTYCIWYYNNIDGIQNLVNYLNATFTLTANDLISPTELTFTDNEYAGLSFTLTSGNE